MNIFCYLGPVYLLLPRSAVPMEKEPESGEGDILRLLAFLGDILKLPKRLDTLFSSTLELEADTTISSSSIVCSLFLHSSALLVVL